MKNSTNSEQLPFTKRFNYVHTIDEKLDLVLLGRGGPCSAADSPHAHISVNLTNVAVATTLRLQCIASAKIAFRYHTAPRKLPL